MFFRGCIASETKTLVFALLSVVLCTPPVLGQPNPRRQGHAARVDEPPVIDGILDEAVWSRAEPLTEFVQAEPHEGQPATERTEVRILYDDATLYVGAICFDSDPEGIVVTDSRRDSPLLDTDSFQMIFDTYHDRQNGFVFGTNPEGIEYDGQVSNEGEGGGQTSTRQRAQTSVGERIQSELGRELRREDAPERDRVDGGVRHPAPKPPLWRETANVGGQLQALHPPEARGGVLVARLAHLQPQSAFFRGRPRGARAGDPAELQSDPLRAHFRQPGLRARYAPGSRRRGGRRREVRRHPEPEPRRYRQHRLRPGGGRRPADQPHSIQPLLSGETALLPGERRNVRHRDGRLERAGDRALLQPADRYRPRRRARAHSGRRTAHGKSGRIQRRRDEHADPGRLRHHLGEQLYGGGRRPRAAEPVELEGTLREPLRHGGPRRPLQLEPDLGIRGGARRGERVDVPGLRHPHGDARSHGEGARPRCL